MSKLKVQKEHKNLDETIFDIEPFDIHLIFACLREAASVKAGILTFEILFR